MWDCMGCGTTNIAGSVPFCPMCGASGPAGLTETAPADLAGTAGEDSAPSVSSGVAAGATQDQDKEEEADATLDH
jgi:hypothetical protein